MSRPKPDFPSNADVIRFVNYTAHAAGEAVIVAAPIGTPEHTSESARLAVQWIRDILDPLVQQRIVQDAAKLAEGMTREQADGPRLTWDDLRNAMHKVFDECCRRLKCSNCGAVNDSKDGWHCSKCEEEWIREIAF